MNCQSKSLQGLNSGVVETLCYINISKNMIAVDNVGKK